MPRRTAAGLEILTAVLLSATLAAAYFGPPRFDLYGNDVSVRSLSRPLVVAALTFAVRLWWRRGASFRTAAPSALAQVLSGALIVAGVMGWVSHNSPTVGGADSYGYVSAAERLIAGDLVHDEPLAAILPADGARVSSRYSTAAACATTRIARHSIGVTSPLARSPPPCGRSRTAGFRCFS